MACNAVRPSEKLSAEAPISVGASGDVGAWSSGREQVVEARHGRIAQDAGRVGPVVEEEVQRAQARHEGVEALGVDRMVKFLAAHRDAGSLELALVEIIPARDPGQIDISPGVPAEAQVELGGGSVPAH